MRVWARTSEMIDGRLPFVVTITLIVLAAALTADAQQPGKKVSRIGYLSPRSRSSDSSRIEAFRQGLRELHYLEEQNIVIEYRFAEGKLDRLSDLAGELIGLKVDLVVTDGATATSAVKKATDTVPIVMTNSSDPVALKFVVSLARPGGNVTG